MQCAEHTCVPHVQGTAQRGTQADCVRAAGDSRGKVSIHPTLENASLRHAQLMRVCRTTTPAEGCRGVPQHLPIITRLPLCRRPNSLTLNTQCTRLLLQHSVNCLPAAAAAAPSQQLAASLLLKHHQRHHLTVPGLPSESCCCPAAECLLGVQCRTHCSDHAAAAGALQQKTVSTMAQSHSHHGKGAQIHTAPPAMPASQTNTNCPQCQKQGAPATRQPACCCLQTPVLTSIARSCIR
jgi:hypothetical protein